MSYLCGLLAENEPFMPLRVIVSSHPATLSISMSKA
jgi:hypothetical protein